MISSSKTRLVKFACEHGGYTIGKFATRSQPKILMYHRFSRKEEPGKVSGQVFEQQLNELKNNFHPFPLQDLIQCLVSGETPPDNSVVITIDDGYRDFHEIAFPLLKKYCMPATVYITSNFVEGKIWLWPDRISWILGNTGKNVLDLSNTTINKSFSLDSHDDRNTCWDILIDHCLTLGQAQREEFITTISDRLGVSTPGIPVSGYAAMSWDHVREIHDCGIEIGAHTANHPVLSKLDDQELKEEINGCKNRIEEALNTSINSFCYPNGQPFDYNKKVKQLIKDGGFNNATVAFYDSNNTADLYELRRYSAGNIYHFMKSIYGIIHISSLLSN